MTITLLPKGPRYLYAMVLTTGFLVFLIDARTTPLMISTRLPCGAKHSLRNPVQKEIHHRAARPPPR